MRFHEIETKYKAEDVKLSEFHAKALALGGYSDVKEVGSTDVYYTRDEETFMRYRRGAEPQLTMKKKSKDTNNYVREEVNLPLDGLLSTDRTVAKFCEMAGFAFNFKIFKTCFIYFADDHNIVYYVVYDEELKERARFIEIEMSESREWKDEQEAWTRLTEIEKSLESLGISPPRRTRKSLFEMFRKT